MKLLTQIRQWSAILSGKPQVQVEDYVLEHLLAYHGLVGSAAENQQQLADDIAAAVEQYSTAQLATALKVPPLWWDEHLSPIFEEIAGRSLEKLAAILSAGDSPETDLLANDDWRVRANAANALALLHTIAVHHRTGEPELNQEQGAIKSAEHDAAVSDSSSRTENRLTGLLSECTHDPFKPAFMHVACALAKLNTDSARQTLIGYLHDNSEPWFRVDAARALTCFSTQETAVELLAGLLDYHPLLDYEAIVIARACDMQELMQSARTAGGDTQEGFCELILGLLQAAKQSSFAQVLEETSAASSLPQLLVPDLPQCSARHIRAALQLAQWLEVNAIDSSTKERLANFRHELESAQFIESIKKQLVQIADHMKHGTSDKCCNQDTMPQGKHSYKPYESPALRESDIRHTIALVGELQLTQLAEQLIALLNLQFVALDETITALGQLGNATAAEPLLQLAQQLVDLDERINLLPCAQPVFESHPAAANSYWLVLGALGRLPQLSSLVFLIKAAHDFAPDKRVQSLQSLIKVCVAFKNESARLDMAELTALSPQIKKLLAHALKDPSSEVRKAALPGVAQLQLTELLPMVRKNCGAKERSLSEEAFAVFQRLYTQGLREPVLRELKHGAACTLNSNLRQRYEQLTAALAG